MKHKIHESIQPLMVEIDTLLPLEGNPRVGNVDAIAASYDEFGQIKPIVVRPNDDGTATVIAGNHQLQAAKQLGWTHIAAVPMTADDNRALAFAMADNRTMELGHTDTELVTQLLTQIADEYSDLLDGLDYDAFEIAAMEVNIERYDSILENGYVPPVTIDKPDRESLIGALKEPLKALADNVSIALSEDGEAKIEARPEVDAKTAITSGSTAVNAAGTDKAVVQYTLVFDNADQQRKWYTFVRWLRNDPGYDGDTTAERLMNFIDSHSNI